MTHKRKAGGRSKRGGPQRADTREATLDAVVWRELREAGGDEGDRFLRMLVDKFLEGVPVCLALLTEASGGADAPGLSRAAHKLKGAASTLGARRLAAICLEMETLGRSGSTSGSVELIARLEEELRRVRSALTRKLDRETKQRKTA